MGKKNIKKELLNSKKSLFKKELSIFGVSLTQKALLAKHLSVMLKAGLTLSESLEIIQEQSSGRLKTVLAGVLSAVKSGQTLANSFARYPKTFSGLFVNVTRAGEASGTLEENLSNITEQLEKERDLVSKIKGAMLYPIVVSVAALGMGLGMAFFVLPKITPLFEGLKVELPLATRILIWSSHLIQNYGIWLLLGIIGFLILFIWLVVQKFSQPVTHWFLLRIPVINKITRGTNLARFSRTLGMLIKSGVNIDEALEITRTTMGNYYFRQSLEEVGKRVSKGSKMADALEEFADLYPKITTRMIKVGEKSGKLEETLFYLANFYEMEVDGSTKALSTIIEPVMLVIIGLFVAFLALSIITPIYEITGNIQR